MLFPPRGKSSGECQRANAGEERALLWCEPDNCYDVLEVHQHNATKAMIKQYFKFSRMYHPDKIGANVMATTASEEEDEEEEKRETTTTTTRKKTNEKK